MNTTGKNVRKKGEDNTAAINWHQLSPEIYKESAQL